jgi:uncharacterized protein (DUF2141 family)
MLRVLAMSCAVWSLVAPGRAAPSTPGANPASGQVRIEVVGVRSDAGQLLAALFRGANGFPRHPEQAFGRTSARIANKQVALVFEHVPAGPFAISLFHDENNDGKLETNGLGMPLEGYAFSRDARGHLGPPSFDAAQLTLAAGEHKRLVVHMEY